MFAIVIKDPKLRLGNLNIFLGKNAIQFEPLAQEKKTNKQTAGALYY